MGGTQHFGRADRLRVFLSWRRDMKALVDDHMAKEARVLNRVVSKGIAYKDDTRRAETFSRETGATRRMTALTKHDLKELVMFWEDTLSDTPER